MLQNIKYEFNAHLPKEEEKSTDCILQEHNFLLIFCIFVNLPKYSDSSVQYYTV